MKKRIIEIRNVRIGDGCPKICVPLTPRSGQELEGMLQEVSKGVFDMIEWRADYFEQIEDRAAREAAFRQIRGAIGDAPLLFTFRNAQEGGERQIDPQRYEELAVGSAGYADLVDLELSSEGSIDLKGLTAKLQDLGLIVIGSSHDFDKTPPAQEMIRRLTHMQETGMDITKLAVMPRSRDDVLKLLEVSVRMQEVYADRPFITMAMGKTGMITRLAGSFDGSAVTFGTCTGQSAPGQLPSDVLKNILNLLS